MSTSTRLRDGRIEVRAPMLTADGHEILMASRVISELKGAGVPVIGWVSIIGVEAGELQIGRDGREMVYRWTPPPEDDDEL